MFQFLLHHVGSVLPVPVLRVEAMRFKVFLAAQVNMSCGFPLLSQMLFDGMEQARADTPTLPCGFDIEPVELHFRCARDGAAANAADLQ